MKPKYTKEMLEDAVVGSFSVSDVLRKLGLNVRGGNHRDVSKKLLEYEIDTKHFRYGRKNKPEIANICITCGIEKEETEFSFNGNGRGKRRCECKTCHNKMNKKYRKKGNKYNTKMRIERHKKIWDYYTSHPCVDCGETDPIVLEFDHVRGEKVASVAKMIRGLYKWETVQEEIEKCEVRCANCHKRRTAKQLGWWWEKLEESSK